MNYFQQESERLHYRKLTEDDIESWIAFFIDNDSLKYFGFDESKSHRELSTEWVTRQIERYEENGLGHLAVIEKTSGNLIGFGGLIVREFDGKGYYEIGYSLKPTSWKKGYGTEIAQQMRKFGTMSGLSDKFISIIHVDNTRSMHVATKNNMTPLFESTYMDLPIIVYGDK